MARLFAAGATHGATRKLTQADVSRLSRAITKCKVKVNQSKKDIPCIALYRAHRASSFVTVAKATNIRSKMSSPPSLILYGVPLSQPFRSVLWPLLIKGCPFTLQLATPGGSKTGKYSTRRSEYMSKFPFATVPAIEDTYQGSKVYLAEAPAILSYLSSKHVWTDLYNSDLAKRSRIDEYCHWHHTNLRSITKAYFRRFTIPHPLITSDVIAVYEKQARTSLKIVETAYLASSQTGYLLGTEHPTIADFMAYEEIVQVSPKFGNVLTLEEYPNIQFWLEKMSTLPYHDEVHAGLKALGDITTSDPPVVDRLGPASKVGLKAIAKAQSESCCDGYSRL